AAPKCRIASWRRAPATPGCALAVDSIPKFQASQDGPFSTNSTNIFLDSAPVQMYSVDRLQTAGRGDRVPFFRRPRCRSLLVLCPRLERPFGMEIELTSPRCAG